jgi:hypothetical protein
MLFLLNYVAKIIKEKNLESIITLVCWCRSQFLPALIEHVRLPLLSQEFLIQRVETEPLLRLNSACKAVFPFTSIQSVNLFDPGFVSFFGTAFKSSECGRNHPLRVEYQ